MALDPRQVPDWQIAQDAEKNMKTIETLAGELGLEKQEVLPYGHYMAKIEERAILNRLASRPNGKYIDVTAITPTPLARASPPRPSALCRVLASAARRALLPFASPPQDLSWA